MPAGRRAVGPIQRQLARLWADDVARPTAQSVRAYSLACLSAAALLHLSDDESSPCFTDRALLTHRRDAKPCVELVSFCI